MVGIQFGTGGLQWCTARPPWSTGPSQSTSDRTFQDPKCQTGERFRPALCAFIGRSLTRESCRFSAGERAGCGRSGDINCRPVLALILLLARFRQGAVGDRSLIRPSAVGEPCPSSARRGPASTEPGLRVAWQTRVVWLWCGHVKMPTATPLS